MGRQSIARDRYGLMNYRMPTLDTVNKYVPKLHWREVASLNLETTGNLILNAMISIPRDKSVRYQRYSRVPLDYRRELSIRKNQLSLQKLTHKTFIRKLLYFYIFPEQYNNNFEDFCTSWITESLFIMRKSIMKQMIHRQEIPLIYNYGPMSNTLYKFPYPLSIKKTIILSNHIHTLLEPCLTVYKELYPELFELV